MPDWFLNANGQVISEDTKRREPMKSIISKYKSSDNQFWGQNFI
jgi:hypothetical protein